MSHPLHSFRLKLNRAQEHAEALNVEIDAWLDRHPYEVFGEYEPGPPEKYVFRVRFFQDIPATWASSSVTSRTTLVLLSTTWPMLS